MFTMDFGDSTFDVIWAENVIFRIGIMGALKSWKRFLKTQGYIVLSTVVKLKESVPDEARNYWERSYPGVTTHSKIEEVIENQDYRLVDSLLIPTSESMEYCYIPLEKRIRELRGIHEANKEFNAFLDLNQEEIDIVRKYDSEFYGSVFYIIQK